MHNRDLKICAIAGNGSRVVATHRISKYYCVYLHKICFKKIFIEKEKTCLLKDLKMNYFSSRIKRFPWVATHL